MKIVFFGTGAFALPALEALREHVSLVVTQPDRPTGRGMKLQASPMKLKAIEYGIRVETPEKSRAPEFVELLQAEQADFLLVASYGQILSTKVLESAKRGGINLHGSILPKYRGAAPIQRCIEAGDAETGITLMQMDKGMDTGDIIDIATTQIGPDEIYGDLQHRLALIAAQQITDWARRITNGDYPRQPQLGEKATMAPKIDRSETELSFTDEAEVAYRKFRAFTPNPTVFVTTKLGRLKLVTTKFISGANETPGTLLTVRPSLQLALKNGALELLEIQPEGKKRMSGADWASGARLAVGDNLSN